MVVPFLRGVETMVYSAISTLILETLEILECTSIMTSTQGFPLSYCWEQWVGESFNTLLLPKYKCPIHTLNHNGKTHSLKPKCWKQKRKTTECKGQ